MKNIVGLGLLALSLAAIAIVIHDRAIGYTPAGTNAALDMQSIHVRIPLPERLALVRVATGTVQGIGTVYHVRSGTLDSCDIGVFYRINKDSVASSRTRWTKDTLDMAARTDIDVPPQVKAFDDFYLVFEPSQAACSTDPQTSGELEERALLWRALPSASLI